MKRKFAPAILGFIIAFLILSVIGVSFMIKKYSPGKEYQDLSAYYNITADDEIAIILNHETSQFHAKLINDGIYLDYSFIHDFINPRFYLDSNENLLLYATQNDLISVEIDSSTYQITKSSTEFGKQIFKMVNGTAYIAIDFVKLYSDFSYEYFTEPNRLVITNIWGEIKTASAKRSAQVRVKAGIKSPILTDIPKGDSVTILESGEKWCKVSTSNGFVGYLQKKTLHQSTTTSLTNDYTPETFTHILLDEKVCMAWHQVTNRSANSNIASVLSQTKGINVISPTWFFLNSNDGEIADLASSDYVTYCHQQNVQVWGLVSNLENKDVDTSYVLTHTSSRKKLINEIISCAIKYELDGINIDFETLKSSEIGDSFIQFIRELSIKCRNNGIILSVDNYVPAEYNNFYNRTEQANYADYLIIMGYDEHYAGSEAGSGASLPWVTAGVENTLSQAPAEQVILGMPFYTRLWELSLKETENADVIDSSSYETSSTVYSMSGAATLLENAGIEPQWQADYGQDYAEWQAEDSIYKIWLENASSMEARLALIDQYQLAGASFWKLGLETSDIWDTIIKYVK